MYEVMVKKPLADRAKENDTPGDRHKVKNEFHARNLARRILRQQGVSWVEVAEVNGRFEVRLRLDERGFVHEALDSPKHKLRRKWRLETGPTYFLRMGALLLLLTAVGVWIVALQVSQEKGHLVFLAELLGLAAALLASAWAYFRQRKRVFKASNSTTAESREEYSLTGRKLR